jgi:hypothetical protein
LRSQRSASSLYSAPDFCQKGSQMTIKKIGVGLISIGLLGILFSFLIDFLSGGKPGIQSAQIFGIEISIVLLLIGAWISLAASGEKINLTEQIRAGINWVLSLPVIAWVIIGFLIAYILFILSPMFLNSAVRITYFNRYLPDTSPIGNDLRAVLHLMREWFLANRSPYELQFYPPFNYVFFAPLLLVGDYATLYKLFTLFSLLSYCFLTLILPIKLSAKKNISLILLLFFTGISSYGFQFELERGQYNIFTILLCLWAIYIFHYQPKYRIFAYFLFSMSVQLKLYPAIFIVMFIDDWKDWKGILRRFAGIAAFNLLLLFIMGPRIFLDFLRAVTTQLAPTGWTWNGNHSINAFVYNLLKDGYGIIGSPTLEQLRQNAELIEMLLLSIFIISLAVAIWISYRRNKGGLDPYLLITCTIGALIIPISNDYTLSFLTAPLSIFLSNIPETRNTSYRLITILLILGIAFAYASVLVPFKYKPYYLNNAFPALFLILIFATILNLIRFKHPETSVVNTME